MTTELFESPGDDICALDGSLKLTCSAQCSPLDRVDYGHLLWTTLAEFPGNPFYQIRSFEFCHHLDFFFFFSPRHHDHYRIDRAFGPEMDPDLGV